MTSNSSLGKQQPASALPEIVLSFICHGAATYVSNPLHVIRTRVSAGVWPARGAVSLTSLRKLRQEQQLWAGAAPNTLQLALSAGIRLGMFPTVRSWFQGSTSQSHPSTAATVSAAACCGAVAGAVIAPLAALKSLLHAGGLQPPSAGAPLQAQVRFGLSALSAATRRMTRLEVTTMVWRGALLNSIQITSLAVPTAWALGALRDRSDGEPLSASQQLAAYAFAASISGCESRIAADNMLLAHRHRVVVRSHCGCHNHPHRPDCHTRLLGTHRNR